MKHRRPMRCVGFGFLLTAALLPLSSSAQTNTAFSGFTQSFNPAVSLITLTPYPEVGLYHLGDDINIQTSNSTPIRVMGMDGSLVYSGAVTTLHLPVGHYFVETPGDRTQFVVLPADYGNLDMLGVNGTGVWPFLDTVNNSLGATWERTEAGSWSNAQWNSSVSDWTTSDARLAIIKATGRKIVYIGGAITPPWIDPTSPQYVQNLVTAYTNFAAQAMTRYGTNIYAWEIWNEPSAWSFRYGTNDLPVASTFLALAKAVKVVRDQIAPSIKLVGPSWASTLWTTANNQYLHANGIDSIIDTWCWHDYDDQFLPIDQDYPDLIPPHEPLNLRLVDTQGATALSKPSLITEMGLFGGSALGCPTSGPPYQSSLSWQRGMCRAIKEVVMNRAAGVAGINLHVGALFANYPNANWEIYGFDQAGAGNVLPRGPHPKTSAFLMSCYWLNHATYVDMRCPGTNVFLYAWRRADNTSVVFAWAVEGTSVPLNNSTFPATDIFGSNVVVTALTETPVLFRSNSSDAAALLSTVVAALPPMDIPPTMGPLSNQSILKNQLLQFTVPALDPNNDPLTYSAVSLPSGASLDPANGAFSWTPDLSQAGVYNLTFIVTDSVGLSATNSTVISALNSATDGIIGWWKFDELSGTTAADSASSHPGTLLNFNSSSGWTPGLISNALAFDGVNDYVSLDGSPLALTNNFSVSCWLKPHDAAGEGVYFCVRSTYAASGFRCWVFHNAVIIEGQTTTGWKQLYFGLGQIQNDTWYHVVIVYDKATIAVYVNGVSQAVAYGGSPDWGGDFVMNPSGSTRIGAENGNFSVGDYYNGLIDDLRVYNRTLIPAEILALYQAVDQPPVLAPISDQTVTPGRSLAFTLSASDLDTATLTYSATGLPGGAALNAATGAFSWIPSLSQTGSYSVTFSASDGSLSDSQTATIAVETAFAAWIASYGVTGPKALPTADADGTGQNNLFKYVAGLDPTNRTSVFILQIAKVPSQPHQNNLIYSPVMTGRTYTVQFCTNLVSGSYAALTGIGGPATNVNQVTVTDLGATQSNKFYRIDITYP